jgi:hypothetical protein
MNLIANTGIQLFTIPIEIDLNNNFKMFFHEWLDSQDGQLKLEIAHFFSEEDAWVKKFDLSQLGYAIHSNDYKITESWDTIINDDEFNKNSIIKIDTEDYKDSGCFQIGVGRINFEKFENVWFPMPFFLLNGKQSEFGPINWCRFKLIPVDANGKTRKYNLLLAFDTYSSFEDENFEDEDLNESPVFTNGSEKSKEFALCNNEFKLIAFCSEEYNCDWIDKYVLKQFHNLENINDYRGQKPKLNYLTQYIYLIRLIEQANVLPKITLFSNQNVAYQNVDLVVDIGNSRTCAILFDNGDFTKSSPLELQDFTVPVSENKINKHKDSFDMRLAFREADLGGNFGLINSRQFVYPSMIRLGKEANNLIHKSINLNTGAEKTTTFSSPKRFLWDTKIQKHEWEFVQLEGEISKPIYIHGISEQLNADGTLNIEGQGGILTKYSRKALMTFAFLEILAQAKMQINSYEQRKHWGNESTPRKIRRILVTCPTAMSRIEQVALRKCAEDAAIVLDRFFEKTYSKSIEEDEIIKRIQVIPSAKKLSAKEERTEWIYDEATAAQFVFLYAEIKERYKKNVKDYFEFYGKLRNDIKDYNKKSLTVGSVDIGAGTTDIMIASYKYEDSAGQCSLTPIPLFWESFYKAGDDLLKSLVQTLVIEGKYSPIEKKIRSTGKNPVELLQPFLGTDVGVSSRNRQLRSDFNLQISVPIVSYFLELLKENKEESKILSFSDIFSQNQPTQVVLNHFKNHFGFEFESLQWQYERKTISAIVEKTFESLIGKISSLFSHYSCDIVLLSGRPTSLKPLTDLFLKHYAISPNRLKSMNDYRVGRWYPEDKRYPFIDGNGKFLNPKSIIATGAMIGQIAENGGLNGFSLNLSELKKQLLPTTNYFGKLSENLEFINTIISRETNRAVIEITSFPFRIGVRQLNVSAYPSRPFYTIDFNDYKIEDRVRGRFDESIDINTIQQEINREKDKIRNAMPLKLAIERDINEDVEVLKIEEITDKEGNSMNKNFIILQVQSMSEIDNFWLDSGVFSLSINNFNH